MAEKVRLRGAWWRSVPLAPSARRLLQLLALSVVVITPAVQLWGVSSARVWNPEELSWRYGPLAPQTSGFFRKLFGSPPEWLSETMVGGAWSYRIGPVELADPIAALTVMVGGSLPAALLFGAGLVLLIHLLFGRLFCAVLCPYGILTRLMLRIRRPLKRLGLVHSLRLPRWIRWVLLAVLLLAPLLGGSLVSWLPYLAVSRWLHALFWGGLSASSIVLAAMLLSDLLLWDAGICRSLCPSGALQGLLGRFRILRLQARADRSCTKGCSSCAGACWLGLDPRGGGPDPDCDGCGRCAPVCGTNRLAPMIRVPGPKTAALGLVLMCSSAQAAAPEVITGTRAEASPFMPPTDPERAAVITGSELEHDGRATWIGVAQMEGEELGLRIYIEEEPGEPYTGPLSMVIRNSDGEVELKLDRPFHPRSVPAPTLYESRLQMTMPATVTFTQGPLTSQTFPLPDDGGGWPLTTPLLIVVGAWGGLFFVPGRRRAARA